MDAMTRILQSDARIAYALRFGSTARGSASIHSDVDIAVGLAAGGKLDHHEHGALVSRLEAVAGRDVDLVLVDTAAAPLAYRIFRDGMLLFARDHAALTAAKALAILRYLDFQPVEALCARGVLRRAASD